MAETGDERRLRGRLKLALPVRVVCRESADYEWVEMTRLLDVTPFGARFSLTRPTEPGRLVHLTLPMPRQLRCFDHVEEQYRVWALVRHTRTLSPPGASEPRFEVGVAFVGKHPPGSYQKDPATRYEVGPPTAESSLWMAHEKARHTKGDRSKETRLVVPVEVTVEVVDEQGKVTAREDTVTENLSRRGAAVFTTLQVEQGRFVRLTSKRYQLSVIAVVRARRPGPDGIPRLHLEFIDQQWPLEGLE